MNADQVCLLDGVAQLVDRESRRRKCSIIGQCGCIEHGSPTSSIDCQRVVGQRYDGGNVHSLCDTTLHTLSCASARDILQLMYHWSARTLHGSGSLSDSFLALRLADQSMGSDLHGVRDHSLHATGCVAMPVPWSRRPEQHWCWLVIT